MGWLVLLLLPEGVERERERERNAVSTSLLPRDTENDKESGKLRALSFCAYSFCYFP